MLSVSANASKVWKRIKGFFSRTMRFIKGITPVVKQIAPAILPGPYGAVVASIANTIDSLSVGVSATAAGGAATTVNGLQVYAPDSDDKFVAQVQYRVLPLNYTDEQADLTSGTDWQDLGDPFDIPINQNVSSGASLSLPMSQLASAFVRVSEVPLQLRTVVTFNKTGPIAKM